jgi:signal transduction protein with GAF and PtsI domain
MRVLIEKEGLDLRSAINLVVARTQELTRADGVAVGLILQEAVTYPARAGIAAQMGGLHFQDNLFHSCFETRQSVLLRDAQEHPRVGARCREEGISSLIIVPIFHDQEVAGGIELLFKDRRTFAAINVEDLELIADVIGEGFSGSGRVEMKQAGKWAWRAEPKVVETFKALRAGSSNEKAVSAGPPVSPPAPLSRASVRTTAAPELVVLGLLASNLVAALARVSDAVKRAWARCGRALKILS